MTNSRSTHPAGQCNVNSHQSPQRWPRVHLGTLCNLVNGDAYKDTDWSAAGVPIIRIQNLNNHAKPFNYWAGNLDDRVQVKNGDVLLAWSGTPGSSFGAHRWNRGFAVLNQHIFRVDLDKSRIDPDWAVFAINEQLDEMIGRAHGAVGLRHVTKMEVESLQIIFPPLPQQRRIAARLREQLAEVEKARAAIVTQLAAVRRLPSSHLQGVFRSRFANKWPRQYLKEVCALLPSKSIALGADTEVRAVTSACLTEAGFNASGIKSARMWAKDAEVCHLRAGEVLIARSNTPELVGRAALYLGEPESLVASDLTIRVWPGPRVGGEFLAHYLAFLYSTGYWKDRAGGASASMKKITRTQIESESIPVPPCREQRTVTEQIQDRLKSILELGSQIEARLVTLDLLPAALLREAFAGHI